MSDYLCRLCTILHSFLSNSSLLSFFYYPYLQSSKLHPLYTSSTQNRYSNSCRHLPCPPNPEPKRLILHRSIISYTNIISLNPWPVIINKTEQNVKQILPFSHLLPIRSRRSTLNDENVACLLSSLIEHRPA